MVTSFFKKRDGNVAIAFSILLLPLCAAVGLAVDYTRHSSAKQHLQETVDAASLALAASKEQNQGRLRQMAQDFLDSNRRDGRLQNIRLDSLSATAEKIDLVADGDIPATFMKLAGWDRLPVAASALAERATRGNVEVTLILDNTQSMEAPDKFGKTRIGALKTAAGELINALLKDGNSGVRIALVPYADTVNVGKENRNASWVNVPADKTTTTTTPAKAPVCSTVTTEQVKTTKNPTYACTKTVDGATFPATCGGGWNYKTVEIPPKEVCTSATLEKSTTTTTTWFGCVGSRTGGVNRLENTSSPRYPGFNDVGQKCVTPIVRLTSDKKALTSAVAGMVTSLPGYAPSTFIPSGLIWGFNTLSPNGPLGDGLPYNDRNEKPRKVAVLMTDGANTLLYRKSDGKATTSAPKLNASERQPYVGPTTSGNCGGGNDDKEDDSNGNATCKKGNPVGTGTYMQTNEDTLAICTNMKAKGIEIFSVAFMVEDAIAESMLKACASSEGHFYSASNAELLSSAFSGIADSLQVVRLAR